MAKFFIIIALVAVHIALTAAAPADNAVSDPNDIGIGTGDKPKRFLDWKRKLFQQEPYYSGHHGYYGGVGYPPYGIGNGLGLGVYPGIGGIAYPAVPAYHGVGAVPVPIY